MCLGGWPAVVLWCGMLFAAVSPARSSQVTNVQTVFLIVMENKDWAGLHGNADCPYLNSTLLPMASRAEQYFTPNDLHPSEPNYIWLEAGTNFGILNDDSPDINHISSTNHLVTLLENAGISWKTYQESYDPRDNPKKDKDPYAAKHNPFIFFDDIATNATRRAQHIRPYSELAADLKNNTVARYNFIVPNLTNDMHSLAHGSHSKEKQGDNWLAYEVPAILSSSAYTNNGALVLVWDEDHNGPIGLIILSPLAKGKGYMNRIHYTHSSLLRTLQEIFRVGPLLGDAANATDLSDLFSDNGLKLLTQHTLSTSPPRLTLTGLTAGRTNVIQASSNLIDWLSLRTNVATTHAFPFTEITHTNDPARFYRILELR
jgi:phosphatidylinositol-3-phosphatase